MRPRGWMLVPAVFAVYLATSAPGLYWRDCPEMIMVAYGLDISHPAGSPTYAMLGKLATMIPLGSIAFRVNLFSGLAAALAAWALFEACRRLLRRFIDQDAPTWTVDLPALLASSMCVFSLSFWSWGTVAEVYALQIAALAAALALALGPTDGSNRRGGAALAFLVLGLGAGVHINLALTMPFFGLYFLLERPGKRARFALLAALAFCIGASVYLYLPVRSLTDIPYDHGNPETLEGLLIHVTGLTHVDSPLMSSSWAVRMRNLSLIPGWTISEFGIVYAILAWIGMAALLRRPREALLLGGIAASNIYLFTRTWNVAFGYIQTFVVLALAGAVPLALSFSRLARQEGGRRFEGGALGRVLVGLSAAAAFVAPAAAHFHLCDLNDVRAADRFGRGLLERAPAEALIVTQHSGLSYPIFYMQVVQRMRPDVVHLHRSHLSDPQRVAEYYPAMQEFMQGGLGPDDLRSRLINVAKARPLLLDYTLSEDPILHPEELAPRGAFARYVRGEVPDSSTRLAAGEDPAFESVIMPIVVEIRQDPRDWSGRELLSQVCMVRARMAIDRGRTDLAEGWFVRGAELVEPLPPHYQSAPYTAPFVNMAGLELRKNRDPDAALRWIEKGLSVDGLDVELLLDRALILQRLGRSGEAMNDLALAHRINPDDPRVGLRLADALIERGLAEQARDVLERITMPPLGSRMDADSFSKAHAALARMDARERDLDSAAAHYMAALTIDPDSVRLNVEYGRLLADLGLPVQGRDRIKLGIKLSGRLRGI